MTREEHENLIKHLKYSHSIGADYVITDKEADEIIKVLEQELCDDCISREQALKVFAEKCAGECACCEYNGSGYDTAENCKLIKSLPSVTPHPKTGHWIHFASGDDCSECGWSTGKYISPSKYCPNCGIKMEG